MKALKKMCITHKCFLGGFFVKVNSHNIEKDVIKKKDLPPSYYIEELEEHPPMRLQIQHSVLPKQVSIETNIKDFETGDSTSQQKTFLPGTSIQKREENASSDTSESEQSCIGQCLICGGYGKQYDLCSECEDTGSRYDGAGSKTDENYLIFLYQCREK